MAFGGTVNRGCRTDTRRFRRVNPLGPNPEEQAKLLGEGNFWSWYDDYDQSRHVFHDRIIHREMQNPDMTPAPRYTTDRTIRLYLIGRTIIVSEIFGDETLGHYDEFREWQ